MELPGDICNCCNKKCATRQGSMAIQHETCYSWVHVTCDGLSTSNEEYDLYLKLSTSVFNVVYCCNLNHGYSHLNQLIVRPHDEAGKDEVLKLVFENHTLLQESISKVLSKIVNLSSQYSELKVKINQLSRNMDTSEESAANLKQGITFDLITNIAAMLFNEKKEKEKRQLNLILYSIKESNNTDISKQKEEDISAAASILRDYVNVPVSINGCFRIGRKCDDLNKPRLLKITVNPLGD